MAQVEIKPSGANFELWVDGSRKSTGTQSYINSLAQMYGGAPTASAPAPATASPSAIPMGGGYVAQPTQPIAQPAAQAPVAAQPAAAQSTTAQQSTQQPAAQPSPQSTQAGAGLPDSSFLSLLNNLNSGFQQNNQLVDQKNAVLQTMLGNTVDPAKLAALPPDIQSIIQSGDRSKLMLQAQILDDSIQGRNATVASSIKYLTDGYQQAQTQAETQKQDAIGNVLKFAQQYGSNAPEVMKSMYGQTYLDQLKAMGVDIQSMASASTITEQRYGTALSSVSVNIPTGTIASQTNNPLNIKFGDFASSVGGTDSGIAGLDGGSFASFQTPEAGLDAAMQLLESPNYQNLTVDQAMKRWSNNGYGADVSPSINGSQKMSSLSDTQLTQLVGDMAKRESGASISQTTSDAQVTAQSLVDGSLPPSLVSAYGGARNKALAEAKRLDPKYDAAKAELQYQASKKWVSAMNSTQMVRYQGLAGSVVNTIDRVKQLAKDMQNSGVPAMNAVKLAAYVQTQGNSPQGQAASQYLTAVNILKEEFANLANGGYAPTDAAWSLANSQINANYGVDQLDSSLSEVQRLINYRMNAIGSVQPVSQAGQFGQSEERPQQGGVQSAATADPMGLGI